MLRQKADCDKKLLSANLALEETNEACRELQNSLHSAKSAAEAVDVEFSMKENALSSKIKELVSENEQLKSYNQKIEVSSLAKQLQFIAIPKY